MQASIILTNFYDSLGVFFKNLEIKDIFDILIVAFSIYLALALFKKVRSLFLFNGLFLLLVVYIVARVFNLYLVSYLFQFFFAFFFIIMAIVFQREVRSFFEMISAPERLKKLLGFKSKSLSERAIDAIVKAAAYFAHNKTGALIVLSGSQPVWNIIEGGTELNGRISFSLLLSIFDDSSPGHDGAVIVEGNQIKSFGAHLPLAERFIKFGELGTRHRSALGMATASDALVVVVSEERGVISVARAGDLKPLQGPSELKDELEDFFKEKTTFHAKEFWKDFAVRNLSQKILALALASWLWFSLAYEPNITTRNFEVPLEFMSLSSDVMVVNVKPDVVNLTLSGRSQDFKLLDPDSLKAVVDASDFSAGINNVRLEEKYFSSPSSLEITNFSPAKVAVTLKLIEPPPVEESKVEKKLVD